MMDRLLRSINLLNILLTAAAVMAAQFIFSPHIDKRIKLPPPAVPAVRAKDEKAAQAPAAPLIDYTMIADHNLFHPGRKIPPEKTEAKALPKPEFVLYGTLVTGELSVAYIDDKKAPMSTPGRGTRTRVLKKGESLSGFVLRSIGRDRVIMARDKEVITVNLSDPKDRGNGPAANPGAPGPGAVTSNAPSRVPAIAPGGRRNLTPAELRLRGRN